MRVISPVLPAMAALAALVAAGPAAAQQYWLPNGPGGTTWNNPQGSLLGTMNEHMLQRHMWQRQYSQHPAMRQQGATGATPAASGDPTFRLNNRASVTMQELYVSSSNDNGWGPDRLGQNVLPGGRAFVVRLPMGQCVNDIRAVFANGQALERRQVNTCALTDLHLP